MRTCRTSTAKTGKKLSKRHGAISVDVFRDDGYLPAALMNFLALLGWSYDDKTTIMSRHELIERFSLERVVPSPATFDYKKLDWMNGMYLRALQPEEYAHFLEQWLREHDIDWPDERVRATAPLVQEKIEKFSQYPDFVRFLFEDVRAAGRCRRSRSPALAADRLAQLSSRGTRPRSRRTLRALVEELGEKPRTAFAPIRLAVTGSKVSPGLFESLELLGRDESLRRLRAAAPPERPRPRERVECALERLPGPEPELRCRHGRARGGAPAVCGARCYHSKDATPGRLGGGYGRYASTDAHTASTPAAQTGQSPSVAPATNASAPTSASRNATSGRAMPSSRTSPSVSRRAAGAARRSRASRTRNSAPRHSGSNGSTASAPWSVSASATSAVASRAAASDGELGVRRLRAGRRSERRRRARSRDAARI